MESEDTLSGSNSELIQEPEPENRWSSSMVPLVIQPDGLGVQEDLLIMLNDPAYSDIQFVCKDGKRVHACRLLLLARSAVLKQMLTNGMAESRMTEISLPDITSAALLPTLEFLYTGAIVKHQVTLDIGYEVLHAARFLLLEKLEEYVASGIKAGAMQVTNPAVLAELLSRTLDFTGELEYSDEVVRHIVEHLRNCRCSARYLKHLSWKALEVYLEQTKSRNEVPVVSFMEYLRLRDILLWSSCQVSEEAEQVMASCFPGEEVLRRHFDTLKTSEKSYFELISPLPGLSVVIDRVGAFMNKCKIDWSKVVALRCIHPLILLKIVKPLGVIRPSRLVDEALSYQALHAGEMNVMKWIPSETTRSYYEILEQGTVVAARQPTFVNPHCVFVVKANMAINKTTGIYEFDVFVEEGSSDMTIGVASPKIESLDDDHLLRMVDGKLWYVIRSGKSRGTKHGFAVKDSCKSILGSGFL